MIPTGPAAPAGMRTGELIAGKYRVERLLGEGGMATVYAGVHVQLREPVALKLLKPEMLRKEGIVQRFVREARAAVRIKSENVARVLDVGTLPSGEPFMVMELLAGQDLRRVASHGPLPIQEAVGYILQACDALAEAHLYGIVHRDLKPANLFLTRRADGSPLVKVLDFGISKMADEADENLTATTDVLGSPVYMSPEQIRTPKDVDHRADIWALGAVLYKLLTGKAAFGADTASASLAKIVADPPPPIRSFRSDIPPELEAVILRCLEKDVRARIQQVDELARALLPFVPSHPGEPSTGSGARRRRSWADPTGADHPAAEATLTGIPLSKPAGGQARNLIIAGALVFVLAGVGVYVALLRGAPAAVAATPAPSASPAPAAPPPIPVPTVPSSTPTTAPSASATAAASAAPASSAAPPSVSAHAPKRAAPTKRAPRTDAFDDRL